MQHQLLALSFLQNQFLTPPPPFFSTCPCLRPTFFDLYPYLRSHFSWLCPCLRPPFWVVPVPKTPLFGCAAAHPHQYILRVPPCPPPPPPGYHYQSGLCHDIGATGNIDLTYMTPPPPPPPTSADNTSIDTLDGA